MRLTLCGSARFEEQFKAWNELLTLNGHIVYSLAVYMSDKVDKDITGEPVSHEWYTPLQKRILDRVHKGKIDNSDGILVLNVDGYVGESTMSEIIHARDQRKEIFWLETPPDWWLGWFVRMASELIRPI